MKLIVKSIVISTLFLTPALPSAACIWTDTHNSYLFSLYDRQEFSDRANEVSNANWKAYMGIGDEVEYYYFYMDEVKKYAAQHGDQLMSSYLENLDLYLDCAREVKYEQWDYPTKEQLAKRQQTLLQVRTYAQSKLKTKLRSQHALLFMRCNMLLGRHQENVTFWEQTASQFIETIYRDMMRDIYAGALLYTGRADEAGQIFAELGDWQSLMTQYYKRRSYQAISEEYSRDPNSAVLPFLLQDFVNNAQETADVNDEGWGVMQGKLFIRDIQKSEALQMCQLARKAVSEKRTKQPVMWQSALAWLEYLFDNPLMARADIARTATLDGTERMKDCARVLRLFISAATASKNDANLDSYLTQELKWMDSKKGDDYCYRAKDRLVHQVLAKRYAEAGRTGTSLGLLHSVNAYAVEEYIDTMSIANLKKLIAYAKNPGRSEIDVYAAPMLELNDTAMNDLLGTKHMRLCQWKEAQQWLAKVPASFYRNQGYALYAAYRQWSVEPWIKRQWLKDDMTYSSIEPDMLLANPKLVFAQEMETLEQELTVLNREARQQRCYDLAVRYAQAAFTGDCWYLMRDGKSVLDTLRTNEADLLAKARNLLREASQTANQKLKERALFALSYSYLYTDDQRWYSQDWDSDVMKYIVIPQPDNQQYKAFAALANFANYSTAPESDYVSRCDEYKQFKKHFK